jgi:3-dehydroquinate synthase
LKAVGLPVSMKEIAGLPSADVLMSYIAQDKKVSRGSLTFILTRGLGQSFIAKDVNAADVQAFLEDKLA